MNNLIPHFIADCYKNGITIGHFTAVSLFMDIAGFTSLTEREMKSGKPGAEKLSLTVNKLYEPIIDIIYRRGGFVSGFAGDAMTVLFPEPVSRLTVLDTVNAIRQLEMNERLTDSHPGNDLTLKIGMSHGDVHWGIAGGKRLRTFYFKGDAIDGCAESEHRCRQSGIVADTAFLDDVPDDMIDKELLESGYYRIHAIHVPGQAWPEVKIPWIEFEMASIFHTRQVVDYSLIGEFREVVSVFLAFPGTRDDGWLDRFVAETMESVQRYGGYFNKIDFGDKGGTMLVLFGAPVSRENDVVRALDWLLHMLRMYGPKIRAGVECGLAYTGLVGVPRRCEYTALGDVVNTSARIAMAAQDGQIWLSGKTRRAAAVWFNTERLFERCFKGKTGKTVVYRLIERYDSHSRRRDTPVFVGREREAGLIRQFLQPLSRKQFAGVMTILGDAGIGKSRLVRKVVENAPGFRTFHLTADDILRKPLNPFIWMLRSDFFPEKETSGDPTSIFMNKLNQLIENLPGGDDADLIRNELLRTSSVLGGLLDLHWEDSLWEKLDPMGRKANTLIALREWMKALSLVQPMLIVLDDYHVLDGDSQEFMETITRCGESFPIGIILTGRLRDDGSRPPLRTERGIPFRRMLLESLPTDESARMIDLLLPAPAEVSLTGFIQQRASGNPFYLEQFCLMLRETDSLEEVNGHLRLRAEPRGIPDDINAIIIARIDRLTGDLKETVQLASVLGTEFEIRVLEALIDLYEKRELGLLTDDLLKEGEHQQIWALLTEVRYIFRHILLREAVYEMQLKQRLRELHELAGQAIRRLHGESPERYQDIAWHYQQSGMEDQAREYWLKAADYHKSVYQNQAAITCYDRFLEKEPDLPQRLTVLKKMADIHYLTGDWKAMETLLENGLRVIDANQSPELHLEFLMRRATLYRKLGRNEEAGRDFSQLLSLLEGIGERRVKSACWGRIANDRQVTGRLPEAEDAYKQQLRLAASDDWENRASAAGNLGVLYGRQGKTKLAMEYFQLDRQLSEKSGNRRKKGVALLNLAKLYAVTGESSNAATLLQECIAGAQEIGDSKTRTTALMNLGHLLLQQGNYEQAGASFRTARRIAGETGDRRMQALSERNLGNLAFSRSQFEEARTRYTTEQNLWDELEDSDASLLAQASLANVAFAERNYRQAEEIYSRILPLLCEKKMVPAQSLVTGNLSEVRRVLGDLKSAETLAVERQNLAGEIGDNAARALSCGTLLEIERMRGLPEKALEFATRAVELVREMKRPVLLAGWLLDRTSLLLQLERDLEADIAFSQAELIIGELDDPELKFRCELLEMQLRGDPGQIMNRTKQMLKETSDDLQRARLFLLRWRTGREETDRTGALEVLTGLRDSTGNREYDNEIKELAEKTII